MRRRQQKIAKRFLVHRAYDPSGVSGTGYVAEGIEFHDGQVAVSWFGKHHILEVVKDLKTWLNVHGHGGVTTTEWLDKKSSITILSLSGRKSPSSKKAKRRTR